jgi:hypothetical protein
MSDEQQNKDFKHDEDLWHHMYFGDVKSRANWCETLLLRARNPRELVRRKLRKSSVMEKFAALGLSERLPDEDRILIFSDVLQLCLSQKFGSAARGVILLMPKDWVIAHIEAASEPLLKDNDNIHYSLMLQLYNMIDRDLAIRFAKNAGSNPDPDVREVGQDFLEG